jgi:DNA-binding beta-propeller fold protein YncE
MTLSVEQNLESELDGYAPQVNWGRLPLGMTFASAATSVAVDQDDRVFVFNRGTPPVVVFDNAGDYITSWGRKEEFSLPHAIAVGPDGSVYLVDARRNVVEKRSPEGRVLLTIGGQEAPAMSGEPFNLPTDVAVHPESQDIFVTDGYGNARVHRFDAQGNLVTSWGSPGTEPGEFAVPHGICLVDNDTVAVCDRENYRVQIFSIDGEFLREWHAFRPASIKPLRRGGDPVLAVAEFNPPKIALGFPSVGHRIGLYGAMGERLGHFGSDEIGEAPDQFINPHSVAVNSKNDIYVAESTTFVLEQLGMEMPHGREIITLRKWRRAAGGATGA